MFCVLFKPHIVIVAGCRCIQTRHIIFVAERVINKVTVYIHLNNTFDVILYKPVSLGMATENHDSTVCSTTTALLN